jgi:hypothetical protein
VIDVASQFTIDPVLARALRDDYRRRDELCRKRPLNAAEELEYSWLSSRITKMAKAIECPAGYGAFQARRDDNRLYELYCKRISPCGDALPDAEDAEEAQLRARVAAYRESPEGLARRRICELERKKFREGCTTAEQSELDGLQARYPEPPLDPEDPLTPVMEGWRQDALKRKADRS